jgi:hypothetical protein
MTMHKGFALALLATGGVLGYGLRPAPAIAQSALFQPFTAGQSVRLFGSFSAGGTSINCTVTSASTEFIACAGEGERPPRWVNLRFVQEITPLPQR